MSDSVRERPTASQQQFGNATATDGSQVFQGSASGNVTMNLTHNHHYSAPERPETPPKPTAIIPFNRDRDFVQRDTILDQVHRSCSDPASRTALVGLGGVGKSQIAIEYAYRVREQSPETWVFWVHASNPARYEQSFRDIADYLKLPERKNSQSNIFQLLYNWLRGEKSGRWILILDNVDAAGFLLHNPPDHDGQRDGSDSRSQPLVSYLPTCQHGSTLITTRSRDVASKLAESRNTITVDPMNQAEAITLAKEKLGKPDRQGDIEAIESLVDTLEYMPLAIVQATAYISQKAPRCSVRQYLEKFTQSDRKRATLLDYEAGQLRRDGEAKNSIIITWQISFDHIRQTRPSAADLLSLMSFCDRQGIPESLLRASDEKEGATSRPAQYRRSPALGGLGSDQESSDEDVELDSSIDDEDEFETDVSSLRDYSFISAVGDGKTFEMHSLVQLATKRWLEAEGQQEKWKSEFIHRLDVQLPTGAYENWATCRALLPHTVSAAAQRPKDEASSKDWLRSFIKLHGIFGSWGEGMKRRRWPRMRRSSELRYLGGRKKKGHWEAAEKLFMEVMETRKQKLGPDHPSTLTSMANLASTYRNQGRWEAAEKLEVEVMETRKQKLGPDHPSTLTSMANLASTYRNQGRWEAAEKLEVEVMETRKQKLGPDYPDTLTSMANLASTYRNQGRWEAAEKLEVEVMETSKQKLGPDHPSTLTSMANLASTFWNQGRWEAAEKLDVEVMETSKQKLGPDHPSTLTSMANLASTFWNQGRWEAAEKLDVEVMETSKQKLGPDHPSTLTSMNNLAYTLEAQGRQSDALELMRECVRIRRDVLGARHPHYLSSLETLRAWELEHTDTITTA
ncbi:hypothetical protein PG997_011493 [Apiospora hydei]|uniref:Kinesin light chain n=1 Tax=Apiospora hydei TaxID=1337664 RepID=A0ABR1VJ78_9PEZI